MREIKFRGKSLIPTVDLNYLNIEHNNGWVFGTYIDGYIVNDVIEANDEYITIGNWVPVDNVGQYTGLKDQKGVEIFEGDIVAIENHPFQKTDDSDVGMEINGNYEVAWNADDLTWCAGSLLLARVKNYVRVIYENPDLLEV